MDASTKETVVVAHSLRTDPRLPPAQIAAEYDDMENAMKENVNDVVVNDALIPPGKIG